MAPLYNKKAGVEIVSKPYALVATFQLRVPHQPPTVNSVLDEMGWQAGLLNEILRDSRKNIAESDTALMEEGLHSLKHLQRNDLANVFDTSKEIAFRDTKDGPVALLPLLKVRLHNEIITVMRFSAAELKQILSGPNSYSESDRAYMKKALNIFNDPAALKAALTAKIHDAQPELAP